jgi:rod shape determining protein RodA
MSIKFRHLVERIDWLLLLLLMALSLMSLLNLYSAGHSVFQKQAVFFIVGYALIGGLLFVDFSKLRRYIYLLYAGSVLLLLLTLAWGRIAGGSQRWLNLGLFHLQSSEPAKLFLVLALARYFSAKNRVAALGLKELLPPALLTAVPFSLILLQPDLGTALMLAASFFSILGVVRIRLYVFFTVGGVGILAAPLCWKYVLHEYQRQRIITWIMHLLGLQNDTMGTGYQILQSKIAVGSGGLFGKGFMQGSQGHLHFLPERHTDFIFAVFAEEWGFIGCILLLGCYSAILLRSLNIGLNTRDRFSLLLVFGVIQLLFWQIVINLLMVLGFLPVVGIPLPLFSFGGSSLLTSFLALGCVFNIRFQKQKTSLDRGS